MNDKAIFIKKIGNTTYTVSVKQSDSAKETLDSKIRKMITATVMSDQFEQENSGENIPEKSAQKKMDA